MMALLAELLEVAKDKGLQARVVEAARTLFQNEDVNVNPVPAIMCGLLLLAIPLFLLYSFPAPSPLDSTGAGYDPPSYGAPVVSEYGVPSSSYGAGSLHSYGDEYRSLSDSLQLAEAAQTGLQHKLGAALSPIVSRIGEAATNLIQ